MEMSSLLSALVLSVVWTLLGASRTALPALETLVEVIVLLPLEVVGALVVLVLSALIGVSSGLLVVSLVALRMKRGKRVPLRLPLLVGLVTGLVVGALVDGLVGALPGIVVGVLLMGVLVVGLASEVGILVLAGAIGIVVEEVGVRVGVALLVVASEVDVLVASLEVVLAEVSPLGRRSTVGVLYLIVVGVMARFVGRAVSRTAASVLFMARVSVTIKVVTVRFVPWWAPRLDA